MAGELPQFLPPPPPRMGHSDEWLSTPSIKSGLENDFLKQTESTVGAYRETNKADLLSTT